MPGGRSAGSSTHTGLDGRGAAARAVDEQNELCSTVLYGKVF